MNPITHLVIDVSSSNEYGDGDSDYCLVPITAQYVEYLLNCMDEVRRLYRADNSVYRLECWDFSPRFFHSDDRLWQLQDVDGRAVSEAPRGEVILLTTDPGLDEDDFQRVECQMALIEPNSIAWSTYVKHSDIRLTTAEIGRETLLRIHRSLGGSKRARPGRRKTCPPAIRRIHDLLYLDMDGGREFYNGGKDVDDDIIQAIKDIVAEHIPRPAGRGGRA